MMNYSFHSYFNHHNPHLDYLVQFSLHTILDLLDTHLMDFNYYYTAMYTRKN